jgi:oligogalacturonide transport system substrate-binding protein
MAPVAPGTKETGIVLRPSQLLTINKNSKNAEAAADFLNWFFNDKEAANALVDSRGVPATESARKALTESNKLDPVLDEATTAATKIMGTPENGISQNQEIEKISVDIIQQLAFGKLTPDKAADTLIDSYNQKLSELKAQK